jgi:diadenosine tetraphosphate (Ap4A) HIT family hydrolase
MIHPQLVLDCHKLGRFDLCTVLLNRNAVLPWFILVPDTHLEDLLDLDAASLSALMTDCQQLSRFIKGELALTKVNFAGLGNVVPQMHLHIIGRSEQDACWPQPVWGNLTAEAAYAEPTLAQWRTLLSAQYGLLEQ